MMDEARSHRAVVLSLLQRDELDEIQLLIRAVRIAVRGAELDDADQSALLALARTVDGRLTALISAWMRLPRRRRPSHDLAPSLDHAAVAAGDVAL